MLKILCIGTEWFSKNGGLSTFNRLLCYSFAKSCDVYCYVKDFSEEEKNDAKINGIHLLKPVIGKELQIGTDVLNQKPSVSEEIKFDLIVGHDRISGPNMQYIGNRYYPTAKKILFIHTVPTEIEMLKPEQLNNDMAARAEDRETIQKDLAKNSNLVVAVGPKLFMEISATLAGISIKPKIVRFDPGLYNLPDKISYDFDSSSVLLETFMMGRLEDFQLKGVDIAYRAMELVYQQWDLKTNGVNIKPRIIIRGGKEGSDRNLIKKFKEISQSSNLQYIIRNYSPDIEKINEEIKRCAITLMPSRAEGFGLVALEAMSLGRPFLVAENTGLAFLLQEIAPHEYHHWVIKRDQENDGIADWAEKINFILKDRVAAGVRLKKIVEIYSRHTDWEKAVGLLLSELGIQKDYQEGSQIVSDYCEIESVDKIEILNFSKMEAGSKLTKAFFSVSIIRRFKIAEELGVIEEGESISNTNRDSLSAIFFKRIYNKSLLASLWSKLFDETIEPNPFKNKNV